MHDVGRIPTQLCRIVARKRVLAKAKFRLSTYRFATDSVHEWDELGVAKVPWRPFDAQPRGASPSDLFTAVEINDTAL